VAIGDTYEFRFVGGPYDNQVVPVTEGEDGLPRILEFPERFGEQGWPPHRYERDGGVYRYASEGPAGD
jgi:hypothetical protein